MAEIKPSLIDLKAIQLEYAFDRGVSFSNRVITISEDISAATFTRIDAALTELEIESKATVTIRINSQGGQPYDAMAIVGRMHASKCPIVTEAYGAVMSAAVAVLAGGKKRRASKHAWLMHHESSYAVDGRHTEIKRLVEQQEREENVWADFMEQHSLRPAVWWLQEAETGDKYLTAEEMLEIGVIDEII